MYGGTGIVACRCCVTCVVGADVAWCPILLPSSVRGVVCMPVVLVLFVSLVGLLSLLLSLNRQMLPVTLLVVVLVACVSTCVVACVVVVGVSGAVPGVCYCAVGMCGSFVGYGVAIDGSCVGVGAVVVVAVDVGGVGAYIGIGGVADGDLSGIAVVASGGGAVVRGDVTGMIRGVNFGIPSVDGVRICVIAIVVMRYWW